MKLLLLTLILVFIGWRAWVRFRRWFRGENTLLAEVYQTVDEWIGARASENTHAANMRRVWGWLLDEKQLRFLWPIRTPGGAQALPMFRRMAMRVELFDGHGRSLNKANKYDGHSVSRAVFHYTTEARQFLGDGWYEHLQRRVAQALGYEWHDKLFRERRDHKLKMVELVVNRDAVRHEVPHSLDIEEELRHREDTG